MAELTFESKFRPYTKICWMNEVICLKKKIVQHINIKTVWSKLTRYTTDTGNTH